MVECQGSILINLQTAKLAAGGGSLTGAGCHGGRCLQRCLRPRIILHVECGANTESGQAPGGVMPPHGPADVLPHSHGAILKEDTVYRSWLCCLATSGGRSVTLIPSIVNYK